MKTELDALIGRLKASSKASDPEAYANEEAASKQLWEQMRKAAAANDFWAMRQIYDAANKARVAISNKYQVGTDLLNDDIGDFTRMLERASEFATDESPTFDRTEAVLWAQFGAAKSAGDLERMKALFEDAVALADQAARAGHPSMDGLYDTASDFGADIMRFTGESIDDLWGDPWRLNAIQSKLYALRQKHTLWQYQAPYVPNPSQSPNDRAMGLEWDRRNRWNDARPLKEPK